MKCNVGGNPRKLTAIFVAVMLMMSLIPFGWVITAFAAPLASFGVQLSEPIPDVTVTLEDSLSGTVSATTDATGFAEFTGSNAVDDAETYSLTLSDIIGYTYTPGSGILPIEGDTYAVTLTPLDTITVSGIVQDSGGDPISGAEISASGYDSPASVTSDALGAFSLTLYKDQSYTVAINHTGYVEQTFSTSGSTLNTSADDDLGTITLLKQTFAIDTSHGAGGTISPDGTAEYDEDYEVTITPTNTVTDHFRLNTVTVDGSPVAVSAPGATTNLIDNGDGTYTYTFYNVTDTHTITASFQRQYQISFTVGANGVVEDAGSLDVVTDHGGMVTVDSGSNNSFTATATNNATLHYHIADIRVNGVSRSGFPNSSNSIKSHTFAINGTAVDTTVVVTFEEDTAPVVTIAPLNPWYSNDVDVSASVSVLSGKTIGEVRFSTNVADYASDTYAVQLPSVTDMTDMGSSVYQFTASTTGTTNYYIWAYDTDGNKSLRSDVTVNIDRSNPIVNSFSIALNPSSIESILRFLTFGAFGNGTIDVTVNVADAGSGIHSVSLYKYDASGNETLVGTNTGISGNSGSATFSIPASFTGTLKAEVDDNVAWPSGKVAATKLNANLLDDAGNIMLETVSPTMAITPVSEASYTDAGGNKWYSADASFTVTTGDVDAGIYSVKTDINGTVLVDKTLSAGKTTSDSFVVNTSQATQAADGSYKITTTVTDNAGNAKTESLTVYKDIKKPSISVIYSNNDDDKTFDGFYKANRNATIKITERNFNPAGVKFTITNEHGTIPAVSGSWTETKDSTNADLNTYSTTIAFTDDGDYSFDVACTDWLGNEAADYAKDTFTLDKTVPVVSVSYSNNDSMNSNYFSDSRTATITITEHNFETTRVNITGTASNDGASVSFPVASRWAGTGDKHTASITFDADAHYTFGISYSDKAGNAAKEYGGDNFYVDTTAPSITITGVDDHSANNGEVAPVVEYTDVNFDDVKIELKGANRGDVEPAGNEQSIDNGGRFTFDNFDTAKEMDDLYTLTATAHDQAGNETTTAIQFSVNRFGSVYAFSDDLKAIEEKYVQSVPGVVITETNVDALDEINIKVSKNGTISDLAEGQDYTMEQTGGAGEWSQYTYTINASVFSEDGKYIVTLYSVDAAGNINENNDEAKKAELWFGVDKTKPVIVPIDIEGNMTYAEDSKTATISVNDNLVLDGVTVTVNGQPVKCTQKDDQYTFTMSSSNEAQTINIAAKDAAGNEATLELPRVFVTTNIFVRWYANTTLFVLSLCGVGVIIIGVTTLVIIRKRKAAQTAS